ncbi:MAG: sortase [Acidimicrobiales bacterium]
MRAGRKPALTDGFEDPGGDSGSGAATPGASPPQPLAQRPVAVAQTQSRARGSLLSIAGTLSAALGLIVVSFVVYLFGFTGLEAYRAQHHLAQELDGPAGLSALNGKTPAEGQPVAILRIPAIEQRQIVVEGTSAKDLEQGPGLMIGAAPPGTSGDVVIAGRRATFGAPFASLNRLRSGDTVSITAALGTFTYRIETVSVVKPGAILPAGPSRSPLLTLVTSDSSLGGSSLLVARAALVGKPVATVPVTAAATPAADFGLAGDSSSLAPAILWGEALLAVLGLGWYLKRRSRQTWLVYAMTAPVAVALALVAFENIAALLPATL